MGLRIVVGEAQAEEEKEEEVVGRVCLLEFGGLRGVLLAVDLPEVEMDFGIVDWCQL